MRQIPLCLLVFFTVAGCSSSDEESVNEVGRPALSTTAFLEDGTPAVKKQPDRVTVEARKFFAEWLSDHGEHDVVSDETGVGVARNSTRLWAFLCNTTHDNDSVSTEIEFRIVLPDGREIMEFLAGHGDTEQAAIGHVMVNFLLSTVHVIYSATINLDDPHMQHEPITISGDPYLITDGGFVTFGDTENHNYDEISDSLHKCLAQLHLSDQIHWGKLVYARSKDEIISVAFTMDNEEVPTLTRQLQEWNWPNTETFYMSKLFFVLRPTPHE